mmetsp:Transcript_10533/g.29983  ORF Transcript_10533/g.29983 Transcript_10533/m.29983 type:complete len:273 (+) Transcript_10533:169-987(+)|eukprot:CAMPEP_0117650182 /NCGR_PEP_ID=MMETSP0804-20121206/1400_1 /TAXON_ID=1074897 /ORGANISM="Tetraselmis astigmatica, Strain CCMP880" /LENGTH=272 /DNA_ID=CAMNT_0005456031 /DNA_START=136 /DNA_END=954 /DNA_ORIENTATION=-
MSAAMQLSAQTLRTAGVLRQPCRSAHQQPFRASPVLASACRSRRTVAASAAPSSPPSSQMLIYVPPHPLIKHWLAVARNEMTPQPAFRSAIAELGSILIYECLRDWLPTVEGEIQSPCGIADAVLADPNTPIKVIPILRAGLVILENAATVLPHSQTYHLGMVRDEETLQPSTYLNKLPQSFSAEDKILIADPMLATGGTMLAAMNEVVSRGASPENIRIISIVAAPPALKVLSEKYQGAKVYTAMIDAEVNDKGFIIPGLGDAGDRAFGTV